MSLPSNVKRALRKARRNGWVLEGGGKHFKLRHPGRSDFITISSSPSDGNAVHNILRDMQRAGAV